MSRAGRGAGRDKRKKSKVTAGNDTDCVENGKVGEKKGQGKKTRPHRRISTMKDGGSKAWSRTANSLKKKAVPA